ncbi:hypothetical protein EVAR_79556_1 [Eumeta japonica]|uniref:Uncharacterized protein n=1 Tax=Eumeta variegata TaxID=151549 RepID=A0A4C1UEF5_EUMVA|nr:hypothetical protein EVAR_79556_1 [Eumeta japonica]
MRHKPPSRRLFEDKRSQMLNGRRRAYPMAVSLRLTRVLGGDAAHAVAAGPADGVQHHHGDGDDAHPDGVHHDRLLRHHLIFLPVTPQPVSVERD